jgi:hypothetical protein
MRGYSDMLFFPAFTSMFDPLILVLEVYNIRHREMSKNSKWLFSSSVSE